MTLPDRPASRRTHPAYLVALVGLLLLVLAGAQVAGQELVSSCSSCRIVADTVAVLGNDSGPGMIMSDNAGVRLAPDGRWYVLTYEQDIVQVFSPEGEYQETLGGEGEGPGEFDWPISMMLDDSGRLHVIDLLLQRITVFDASSELVQTITVPGFRMGYDLAYVRGDSLLVSGYSLSEDLYGLPLHVIDSTGTRGRSFGAPDYPLTSRDPAELRGRFVMIDNEEIWLSRTNQYRLERWTLEGEHVETLETDAPWMTKPEESPNGPASPTPRFNAIQSDDEGLLWLGFSVAGADWRGAVTGSPGTWAVEDIVGYRDNLVQVVDVETGSVLASRRFTDLDLGTLFGGTHVATVGVDLASGSVRLHVLRLSLQR